MPTTAKEVTIWNATGQLILTKEIEDWTDFSLPIVDWENVFYWVSILTENGQQSQKVIVQQ